MRMGKWKNTKYIKKLQISADKDARTLSSHMNQYFIVFRFENQTDRYLKTQEREY